MDPYKKETREYYKAIGEAPRYQDLRKLARARRQLRAFIGQLLLSIRHPRRAVKCRGRWIKGIGTNPDGQAWSCSRSSIKCAECPRNPFSDTPKSAAKRELMRQWAYQRNANN